MPYSESQALNFVRDTARGLAYLHGLRIIHRAVHPRNVLIYKNAVTNEPIAKLSDMAHSCFFSTQPATLFIDSKFPYSAPEITQLEPNARFGCYTLACDVYSLAIVTAQALTRKQPHKHMYGKVTKEIRAFLNTEVIGKVCALASLHFLVRKTASTERATGDPG